MSRTLLIALVTILSPLAALAGEGAGDGSQQKRDFAGLTAALNAGALRRQSALMFALSDADAQAKALNFLGSHQAHREAIASLQQCQNCHSGVGGNYLLDAAALTALQPQGPWIGVSVGPADGVLRAQLRLPEGTGVVVTQVVPNGPAQHAGVEEHDVLLSVDGKPIASGEGLDKILQSARTDGTPLTIKLLRRGVTVEKQVTPRRSDAAEWLSTFAVRMEPAYRIGIQASDPDETLKKQLGLEGRGVVVTEVLGGKPADVAGVKSGDVLLSVNGQPVATHEELPAKIQAAGETPVELELLRGGVTLRITVTPVKEQEARADNAYIHSFLGLQSDQTRELMLVQPQYLDVLSNYLRPATTQPATTAERMKRITDHMAQLQRELAELQAELAKQPDAKPER